MSLGAEKWDGETRKDHSHRLSINLCDDELSRPDDLLSPDPQQKTILSGPSDVRTSSHTPSSPTNPDLPILNTNINQDSFYTTFEDNTRNCSITTSAWSYSETPTPINDKQQLTVVTWPSPYTKKNMPSPINTVSLKDHIDVLEKSVFENEKGILEKAPSTPTTVNISPVSTSPVSTFPPSPSSPPKKIEPVGPPPGPPAPTWSKPHEYAFIFTVCLAQIMSLASLAQTVAPLLKIGDDLKVENPGQLSWFTAAYSMSLGTFIIPAGM
jgi:hypothetical protein